MRNVLVLILLALFPLALLAAEVPDSRQQVTLSFAPVVKRTVPAVVNIYTRHVERAQVSPFMNDPLFRQFFGDGFGGLPRERVVSSLGSGVIISPDGLLVTSYHVVDGSDEINVVLADRREFTAKIEKRDEKSDLAILRIDAKGAQLPYLQMRDSDMLEVGDLVLAIGNPFGVGQTVTSGIISALARTASDVSDYQFFIQTDAAINPGNSGGALVDNDGKLIGINTAIYSRTGGYQGIGFAIPSNMVQAVLRGQTGKSGSLIRPWFGVAVQPVTREIADAQGIGLPRGVLVQKVSKGSPAEQAGIRPGDIILSIGSGAVNDAQSLNFRMTVTGIGQEVPVTLWRSGSEEAVPVTFTAAPERTPVDAVLLKGKHPLNGATVADITPELAEELKLPADTQGVIIVKGTQSMGFGMGMQTGDIIMEVNDRKVQNVDALRKALSAKSRSFKITLIRGGMVMTLVTVG